jgi:hypothetical protein
MSITPSLLQIESMAFLGRALVNMFASWLPEGTKGVTMPLDSTLERMKLQSTSICLVLSWKTRLLVI